jgi:hypothetical protein
LEQDRKKLKVHCIRCGRETNHLVRDCYEVTETADHGWWETEEHSFLECAGCETSTLMVKGTACYMDENEQEISYYPERKQDFKVPKSFHKLPLGLKDAYLETVKAYNFDALLLCTIGLRTLIEGICDDKGAVGKTLETKIDGLRSHLSSGNIVDSLHGFRFSGNDAAHELAPLTKSEANIAISVMEDLLNYLYDLDYKASRIKYASKRAAASSSSKSQP